MTIVGVDKDPARRTLRITSEFGAPPERVWRMWSDPRRLEKWWGPPDFPATVTEHDLRPGGRVALFVTGACGVRRDASWRVISVDEPTGLAFDLHDPDFPPIAMRVRISAYEGGTRMVIDASFPTDEAMDRLLSIGFAEGLSAAVAQLDDAL
jgi:uncharacterized protein YndB with AHSA1/START domain